MAKLPPNVSLQAIPVQSAMSEGRTADAVDLVVALLVAGNADKVVQSIAAELLKPKKKARGRQKALPRHWYEIAEDFHRARDSGVFYEDALALVVKRYGYSETHVRGAIKTFDKAREAHDKATRE